MLQNKRKKVKYNLDTISTKKGAAQWKTINRKTIKKNALQ